MKLSKSICFVLYKLLEHVCNIGPHPFCSETQCPLASYTPVQSAVLSTALKRAMAPSHSRASTESDAEEMVKALLDDGSGDGLDPCVPTRGSIIDINVISCC